MVNLIIYLMIACILGSLVLSLFYFIRNKNRQDEKHIAQSLTIRMILSLVLVLFLIIAYCIGWIAPHKLPF